MAIQLIPDKFKDLSGPVHVGKEWLADMNRIDDRLVLRWQPKWGLYAVFVRLERCDKLWPEPVHICRSVEGGYRTPTNWDLGEIRKAHYYAVRDGSRHALDQLDLHIRESERKVADDRKKNMQEYCRDAARRCNVTASDLLQVPNVTRKPFNSGAKRRKVG